MITWDERGFGQTEFDGEPFTYWDSADDCLALLDHLGIERAVVGGMSQGGFISLRVALRAPERVRGLILLDTQAGVEDPEVVAGYDQMRDMWLSVGPVDELADNVANLIIGDPAVNPFWVAKWQARPKELFAQPYATLVSRDDVTDRLGEITCPAVVIHGTEDTSITMDRAEALADGLPGAGPVVKVGGAHAANLTEPRPGERGDRRVPRVDRRLTGGVADLRCRRSPRNRGGRRHRGARRRGRVGVGRAVGGPATSSW